MNSNSKERVKRKPLVIVSAIVLSALVIVLLMHSIGLSGANGWNSSGLSGKNVWSIVCTPNFSTSNTVFAGTADNGIYKSTNKGSSWTLMSGSGLTSTSTAYGIAVSPAYALDNTVFIGTAAHGIFKTTNGGTSWNKINSGSLADTNPIEAISLSPGFTTDQTLFVATDNGVFRSANGGTSWTLMNTGGLTDTTTAYSVAVAQDASSTVFVGAVDTMDGLGGVYKTTNGGTNWSAANTGLGSTWINAVALAPDLSSSHLAFAGTGAGLYKSTNTGANWSLVGGIPSTVSVIAVTFSKDFATDHTIFAGTDAGVYRSTDSGTTWTQVNTGLTGATIAYALAISPSLVSDSIVFAGTDNGVFITDITPPTVTGVSPNGTNVPINTTIRVTFNEDMKAGAGFNNVVVAAGGNPISINKSISGNVLTITPSSNLSYGMQYAVTIPANAISDLAENNFTIPGGLSATMLGSDLSFDFSTVPAPDTAAPTVTGTDPGANAKNVAKNKTIAITFSEALVPGGAFGGVGIRDFKNRPINVSTSISGNTLLIAPRRSFGNKQVFSVVVPADAVRDAAGNSFAGLSYKFTAGNQTVSQQQKAANKSKGKGKGKSKAKSKSKSKSKKK